MARIGWHIQIDQVRVGPEYASHMWTTAYQAGVSAASRSSTDHVE
jgi:hypothetical protein